MNVFPAKTPSEQFTVTFDFTAIAGGNVSAPTVLCTVFEGTDTNPSAVLNGSPTTSGKTALQGVKGGLDGVTYNLQAIVVDGSNIWELEVLLPVVAIQ